MPNYSYEEFRQACDETPENVIPIGDTLKNAEGDFQIRTKSELLNFISDGGPENLKFVNTKVWEKNPSPNSPIMVDAYEFKSLSKLGYLAFMRNEKSGKWLIKSFHLSTNRNTTMEDALKRAGIKKEDQNE
ncbi:MAG: hypothetical protein MUF77_07205 [Leptospira sp.]|jgi:hypothetical protein|nr:hypothetical protein [Leptospira sp.]